MRVLVTGASGLIGRHVTKTMSGAGHDVIALTRGGKKIPGAAETVMANLLDQDETLRVLQSVRAEALLHLAWYGGTGRLTSPENLDWAAATIRLVTEFARLGGKRVVAAGSCAEYDWARSERHRETDTLRPQGLYGSAKARTGELLMAAAPTIGVTLAWARIFFVYGPCEPRGRLMGDLIQGLKSGEAVPCTDGMQIRDFLHAHDVARALGLILDRAHSGAVNIASGKEIKVRDLIDEVARQMGAADLVKLGAIARPETDPDQIRADVSLLTGTLGFIPEFDLVSGIADVIKNETTL